ncbi:hypothetical protein UFOVP116_79 [uncultured Caudovirales phage]|uniref:Uncharacterized protein n=1 Tax=uncultured Caudovirales phage TaxID=2100421 RepID=A0A6J5LD89_9CAUD|nr:hypothetical protein UFOVP116_79 [uncultured Caudovirales phage]
MDLNEIKRPNASKKLNKIIESRYGLNIDISKLTPTKATAMIAQLNEQIEEFRRSNRAHSATQNPVYMKMVMIKESLSTYMKDYKPANAPGAKTAPKLTKVTTGKQAISEMSQGKNLTLILKALRYATEGRAIPHKCMEGFVPLFKHLSQRTLTEDALAKSEVILAARSMVDTLQGMVEDLSKMINEEMLPLMDSIRDQIGSEQAQTFGSATTQALNDVLTSVKGAREQMDSSVRALAGEEGAAPMKMAEPAAEPEDDEVVADLTDGDDTDGFAAADAATGGTNKLGREAR